MGNKPHLFFYFMLTLLDYHGIIRYKQKGVVVMDKQQLEKLIGEPIDTIRQVALPEEQEVNINILYNECNGLEPELVIYTNIATIMRRILKRGYAPAEIDREEGSLWSMTWRLPIEEVSNFMRTGIFKR